MSNTMLDPDDELARIADKIADALASLDSRLSKAMRIAELMAYDGGKHEHYDLLDSLEKLSWDRQRLIEYVREYADEIGYPLVL